MKIVRNLIKYTLGLPILLFITFNGAIGFIVCGIMGDACLIDSIIETIKDIWKPIK